MSDLVYPRDGDAHLGEVASAYLDGELDEPSRSAAEAHLAGCAACRAELEGARWVHAALRALGPVDPPPGFFDAVLANGPRPSGHARRRRRVRVGAAQLAATAGVWLVILAFGGLPRQADSVAPAVSDVLAAHTSALTTSENASDSRADSGSGTSAASTSDSLPAEVGGSFRLVEVRRLRGMVQAIYARGSMLVSVFMQEGELNERGLPPNAERISLQGVDAYRVPWESGEVVILQRGRHVFTLVAPSAPLVSDVPGDLPDDEPSPSMGDRLRDAASGLVDSFGLGG